MTPQEIVQLLLDHPVTQDLTASLSPEAMERLRENWLAILVSAAPAPVPVVATPVQPADTPSSGTRPVAGTVAPVETAGTPPTV